MDSSPRKNSNTSSVVSRDRRSAIFFTDYGEYTQLCGKIDVRRSMYNWWAGPRVSSNEQSLTHALNSTMNKLSIGSRYDAVRFTGRAVKNSKVSI